MADAPTNVETLAHSSAIYTASYNKQLHAMATAYINQSPRQGFRVAPLSSPSFASTGDTIRNTQSSSDLGSVQSPNTSFTSAPDKANTPCLHIRGSSRTRFEADELPSLRSSSELSPDLSSKGGVTYTEYLSPTRIQRCDSSEKQPSSINSSDVSWRRSNRKVTSPTKYPTRVTRSPLRSICDVIEVPYTPFQKRRWPLLPIQQVNESRHSSKRRAIRPVHHEGDDEIIKETTIASSKIVRYPLTDKKVPSLNSSLLKSTREKAQSTPGHTCKRPKNLVSAVESSNSIVELYGSHGYTYDSLDIRAPEPAVGEFAITPEDLVTPALAKLAEDLSIPRRFQAESRTRQITPFERGFWQLDCSGWDSQLRLEGWAFLTNYVASGSAGWGVRSVRDEDFQWIRVYCWGHVVPHIYLLLYLASQRQILITGSSWCDGMGEEIITTRKRSRL